MTNSRIVTHEDFKAAVSTLQKGFVLAKYAEKILTDFNAVYPPSVGYIRSLMQAMNPEDPTTNKRPLTPEDLERVLIGILAAREPGLELAIHVYLGLMYGLEIEDVAATVHVAGVYTGVDNFASGLLFLKELMLVFEELACANTVDAAQVIDVLTSRYGRFARA